MPFGARYIQVMGRSSERYVNSNIGTAAKGPRVSTITAAGAPGRSTAPGWTADSTNSNSIWPSAGAMLSTRAAKTVPAA